MTVSSGGSVSYDGVYIPLEYLICSEGFIRRCIAWFMWLPDFDPIDFNSAGSNITFSPGDLVTFTLLTFASTSRQQGVAIVTNGATGALAVENVSADTPLCMNDAEWTVQTFDGSTPLANFGTVTFANALALTSSADPGNLPAVSRLNLERTGGPVLTSTSIAESSITINYVGP